MIFIYYLSTLLVHIPYTYKITYGVSLAVTMMFFINKCRLGFKVKKSMFYIFIISLLTLALCVLVKLSILALSYLVFFFLNFVFLYYISKGSSEYKQITSFILVSLILASFPIFYNDGRESGKALASVYGNSNTLAVVLFLPLYFLCKLKSIGVVSKYKFIGLFLWFILLILLCKSRSAYLFLFVVIVIWSSKFILSLRVMKVFSLIGICIILSLYYLIFIADSEYSMLFLQALSATQKGGDLGGRDYLAQYAFSGGIDNPMGVGLGHSSSYIKSIIGNGLTPHNTYLKALLEGGIAWLACVFIFVLYSIFIVKNVVGLAFIVGLSIQFLFESSFFLGGSLYSLTLPTMLFFEFNNYFKPKQSLI